MTERTLVASATNLLARGFLVVPTDRKSRAGEPVNGLFAVARAIRRVIAFKVPARAVAVVEREPAPAWPELLKAQLPALPALLRALGCTVVEVARGDEVHAVAAYATAGLAGGGDAIIVGVDKRYAQLVGDRLWWYDANKDARYTSEIVVKRFGVGPDRVGEWLGMVGDEDQLPGVAGIGAKGATTLLTSHATVAAALVEVDAIKGRLGNALRAAVADGSLAKELAHAKLDTAHALPEPLAACAYAPPVATELNAAFDRLGFAELLVTDGGTQVTELVETWEALSAFVSGTRDPVAIHAMLEDDGAVAGIALVRGDGAAIYTPRTGLAAAWLADPEAKKLGHDLVGTTVAFAKLGVALAGVVGDSAVASHLTQPSNWAPHDLQVVAKFVLGRALPDDDAVRGVGRQRKAWGALPPERVAEVAGQRAAAARAIWDALAPAVPRANIDEYLGLTAVCARMERTGIIVDPGELDRAEQAFVAIEAELAAQIYALAGRELNINSSPQLGKLLFEDLKLPIVSHTKTGWSTSIDALERIEHAHPIVPLVLRWRSLRRLRDSWVSALRRCIHPDDGRVHGRFWPARSFSGHLVNTNPDLGRVPGRTPEMAMIRRAFVAPPGWSLVSIDFNQLGLHVLAHLTKDPALVEPLRARADMHRLTAAAVLEKPIESLTDDDRQLGKVVNFATFAGQGPSALALQLDVPAAEARELIARFDKRYTLVRAFQDRQLELAKTRGYIETIAGRRWPIGGLESLDSELRSYAERLARRATHEGSVSDVSRRALLDADRALRAAGSRAEPLNSILDEVLFAIPDDELHEAAAIAARAMRGAFAPLEVPLVVGVEVGKNWADIQKIEVAS